MLTHMIPRLGAEKQGPFKIPGDPLSEAPNSYRLSFWFIGGDNTSLPDRSGSLANGVRPVVRMHSARSQCSPVITL